MCGIAGIMGGHDWQADALHRMSLSLQHRGPDDHGVWFDSTAPIGLAHRRLSILDLSPAGHQPMTSRCGRYVIVFNGEIYNHLPLRRELASAGTRFSWEGHADTETLLAGFTSWGIEGTLKKSVGMFAFAVWDKHQRKLCIARDRAGEKPLYYGLVGGSFVFASELSAIRKHPLFQSGIDRHALSAFMRRSYVPAPSSIYVGIKKLTPGTMLSVAAESLDKWHVSHYWTLDGTIAKGKSAHFSGSDTDAVDRLESLLTEAVNLQQIADVPLGAFLSGGIDSSLIVALMQSRSATPIHTYTIGFDDKQFDEASHARAVAEHLGTKHSELYVTASEARSVIPHLPSIYDEPFADSSQIPTYLVSKLARQEVIVSLSGDGGDELFGGYNRYFWARRILQNPLPLRKALASVLTLINPSQWDQLQAILKFILPTTLKVATTGDKLHKLALMLGASSDAVLFDLLTSTWPNADNVVLRDDMHSMSSLSLERYGICSDLESKMMACDFDNYLPDDILCKVDRAAMSVSLETRVPFLDHRVIEFAWQLPLRLKMGDTPGDSKWILRQLLNRFVPKSITHRPKMGFGVPLDRWLRGPLRQWSEDLLGESRLKQQGFLDVALVRQKWHEHLSGRRNWQYALWNALVFQMWVDAQAGTAA